MRPLQILGYAFAVGILGACSAAASEWQTLEDCRLVVDQTESADTPCVEHQGKKFRIRFYFVDSPESTISNPERVADQAAYFQTSEARVLEAGLGAMDLVKELLSDGFVTVTRFAKVSGSGDLPCYYGFVFVDGLTKGEQADVNAILVSEGLARTKGLRVHAPSFSTPDSTAYSASAADLSSTYEKLEAEAKRDGAGIWGTGPIRKTAASDKSAPPVGLSGVDPGLPEKVGAVDLSMLPPDEGEIGRQAQDKKVSFSSKSETLYQRNDSGGSSSLSMTSREDSLVKLIDYKTGRLVGMVWLRGNSRERFYFDVSPEAVLKVVYAQGLREMPDGKFAAAFYGKLADPVDVRMAEFVRIEISINSETHPNVVSSAEEFGSFRPPGR